MRNVSVNAHVSCVQQCFHTAHTVTLTCTNWRILTGQVKTRT